MKYAITILSLVVLFSCKTSTEKNSEEDQEEVIIYTLDKKVNNEFEDPEDGGMMLLGKINKTGLEAEPYSKWFKESQANHTLDTRVLDSIKPLLKDVTIKVFMGTWCEDSQREVPALYKILDSTDFNYKNFSIVALSHDKDTPIGLERGYAIEYVPTIIFMRDGDTLNRIVEYAHKTLEQDMLTILKDEAYLPAYSK
ncbi:TlpA family protein disulfide reductase [Rasiella sp. SM2506]|uniref:TlpA family protein disulfide reductase n=1 Tax=Rasiella sp. SM2506 TaxID=3423914 RepID=UPI003D7B31D2